MNNKVKSLVRKLNEDFDFDNVKNTKSKNITKTARKAVEDYKESLINLNDYRIKYSKYHKKIDELFNIMLCMFKGLELTSDNVDLENITNNFQDFLKNYIKEDSRTTNAVIFYYIFDDLGYEYMLNEDFSNELYIAEDYNNDNAGIYELIYRALDAAE
jgi:hypothetical protein